MGADAEVGTPRYASYAMPTCAFAKASRDGRPEHRGRPLAHPFGVRGHQFTRIYYNPPGNDVQSNSQIVKEYVEIKNTGKGPVALTNWRIIDVDDKKVFRFPTFTLAAGKSLRVRSGVGRNTKTDLYWRHDNYIWNNDEKRRPCSETHAAR